MFLFIFFFAFFTDFQRASSSRFASRVCTPPDRNASAGPQPREEGGTKPPIRRRAASSFQQEAEPPRAVKSVYVHALLPDTGGLSGACEMIKQQHTAAPGALRVQDLQYGLPVARRVFRIWSIGPAQKMN